MKVRGFQYLPWGLILIILVSACGTKPLQVDSTATPTQTPTATATLIPLIRPGSPTPVINLGINRPIEVTIMGEKVWLNITSASETMKTSVPSSIYHLGYIEPPEGFKLVVIYYDINKCPSIPIDPVLIDENEKAYREGYKFPESETQIRSDNCISWVFSVPLESRHFTLLVPVNPIMVDDRYYEVHLDDILGRLEVEEVYQPPPAPTNCLAEALSATEVMLSWEMPIDRTDYDSFMIYSSRVTVSDYFLPKDARYFKIDNLLPDTHYYFEIMTYNENMDTASCDVEVTTLP